MIASGTSLQTLIAAAAAARRKGEFAEELRMLDRALAAAPGDPQAHNARGMRALADLAPALAKQHFAAATAADPAEAALWMNLATAQRALGEDEGEQDSLERALGLNRVNFMAQLRMAELCQRRGRAAEAVLGWRNVLHMAAGMDALAPTLVASLDRGRTFLAEQTEGFSAAIDAQFGPAMEKSEAFRFKACIDHMLGRRAIYQNQCAGVHYPFLPAEEFFDRKHFPWLAALEARTDAIRAEALALMASGAPAIRPYVRQEAGTPGNKWSPLDHSLDWSACFLWEYGEKNDEICAICPETAAALAAVPQNIIPGKAPSAFFSILKPHAHIPPHTGVTNTRTIIHLPLVVPEGCRFRVGGETRAWKEGEAFAFDDTIEHEAWNDSDAPRIVLILDVWNPYLSKTEQSLLQQFFELPDDRGSFLRS